MIEGLFGISYSTDKIGENGRFIDSSLESDFMQTRYDILRNPDRRGKVNESAWRKGGVGARRLFLKMIESANSRPLNQFGMVRESEDVLDSDTMTYTGEPIENKKVKTIIVAPDVAEIPDGTFKDFGELLDVVFPDDGNDIKIGKNAFEGCQKLTHVRLNGVTYIGDEAFLNCVGLVAVELGSQIQHIGMGAFKNCTKLTAATVPPNVTFIGDYAFANCSELVTATVMEGVVEVPSYCFENDVKLEQVVLPTSMEKVGEKAFSNCPSVVVMVPTMDREEAEDLLGVKMVAKAEDDDTILKCDQGYVVRLYKDLY